IGKIRPLIARRTVYAAWLETGFQSQIRKLGPDLVHFTNHLVPRARKSRAKYAVTIHDLTAWRLPEAFSTFYVRYIHTVVPRALKLADLVLCPSNAIRNEVIEHFNLKEEKVRTAWNANTNLPKVSAQMREEMSGPLRRKLGLRKPFVLFVGTLERRKNVATLVEAFARVARTHDLQLVLAGRPGHGFSEIEASIERQGDRDRYILTGYVSDEELAMLYTLADVFAYPSRYEGFGIPLVEAMSFGLPIVASRIPASEEVAADAAIYYDDPLDAEALAGKLLEALDSSALMSVLGSRGRQRAEIFSWKNVAQMYIDAYKSALNA
ncbi:MAG TPA: glycosyltransferase family 1 protein, partial [Terriglobia bacterium]|nr:glycosyltransferase family 1 protein [Terriglobia bacterium]